MPRVIPLKFHEMSLVMWNLTYFCKITQLLIKFCKSLKDFRKILSKWLGKTFQYCLNLLTFIHALKNGQKLANFCLQLKWKFTVFHKGFLGHKLLVLAKFHLVLSSLWPKSFALRQYHSYLVFEVTRVLFQELVNPKMGQSYKKFHTCN